MDCVVGSAHHGDLVDCAGVDHQVGHSAHVSEATPKAWPWRLPSILVQSIMPSLLGPSVRRAFGGLRASAGIGRDPGGFEIVNRDQRSIVDRGQKLGLLGLKLHQQAHIDQIDELTQPDGVKLVGHDADWLPDVTETATCTVYPTVAPLM